VDEAIVEGNIKQDILNKILSLHQQWRHTARVFLRKFLLMMLTDDDLLLEK